MWRQLFMAALLTFVWVLPAQAGRESPGVGTVPPDFKARSAVSGEQLRLSAQQGKIVVLTFWATWCGPCRKELPILEGIQRQVGKDRLEVFAVAFHESPENFRTLKKLAATGSWQLALIEDDSAAIASRYGIKAIPHLFIIGRDGKILAEHTGYGEGSIDELVEELNRALRPDGSPGEAPSQATSETSETTQTK
jgi:thiol-disulfide isomerase/thioredoxin